MLTNGVLKTRSTVLAASLALVVGAGGVFGINALTGGDGGAAAAGTTISLAAPGGSEVTLEAPDGWKELSAKEVAQLPGSPLAVLRREDGQGLVTVNAHQGTPADLSKLAVDLDRRLRREIPDFRKVNSRTVQVKAGEALLYSYARRTKGTAHTLLVVPAGKRSYTLGAAVSAGSQDAAREAGQILFGFGV
jgi:hypothetical protein